MLTHKDEIISSYLSGATAKEIAIIFDINGQTVLNFLRKNNVSIRQSNNVKVILKEKCCIKCGNIFPHTAEFFFKKGQCYSDGSPKLRAVCKKCDRIYGRNYNTQRKKNDLNFRLRKGLSARIRSALRHQNSHKTSATTKMLGCSIVEFKVFLQNKFLDGMTWENYGEWHIDHIKPCAAFDLTRMDEQYKCFNFSNLQPLWEEDNHTKNSFYDGNRYYKKQPNSVVT